MLSFISCATASQDSQEEVGARIKGHAGYHTYAEMEVLFLPFLHQDLHTDFRQGFGALMGAPQASARLSFEKENAHIACLYGEIRKTHEDAEDGVLELQKLMLYARLSVPAHLAYFDPEFAKKIQGS